MARLIALILLATLATPAIAAAQDARSIDDLLERANPGPAYKVTDPQIRPDGERSAEDQNYERLVLRTFRTAQNRLGGLDGRWQAQTLDGRVLYTFTFTDPGSGSSAIVGAWADPRRQGVTASGFVQEVIQSDGRTVIVFQQASAGSQAQQTRVSLQPNGSGAWRGELADGGASTPVVMIRMEGIETMAIEGR